MCNIAFQLVFQQCYETSSTVHRTFYRNISFVICGAFILGEGGQKEVLHKRQSSDLGTLKVESIGICSIEKGIARKKETSHNRSYGFPSNLTLITFIYQNYNCTNLCVTIFIY